MPRMDWNALFSRGALSARRSAVRELLKVAVRPDLISFAGGLPAPELFPIDAVRDASARVLADHSGAVRALQYGESEGLPELREWLADRESLRGGVRVSSAEVMITHGAQQALDLVGRCFLEEGSVAAVENPTYLALLSAWRAQGAGFVAYQPVAFGSDDAASEPQRRFAPKPTCLYAQPNFQNPTGVTWSLAERREVVAAARRSGILVVEDDPYGDLGFEGDPPASLFTLDAGLAASDGHGGNVVRIGTFSKVLAPGLRLGWVVAPVPVIERLVSLRQAMDLHPATFTQAVALELVLAGTIDRQLPGLRRAYRERCDAMIGALAAAAVPGWRWTRPDGGMFLWAQLPVGLDAGLLLRSALEAGVAFVPGVEFHLDRSGHNTLRLNYSHGNPARIREGVRRLIEALQAGSLTLAAASA